MALVLLGMGVPFGPVQPLGRSYRNESFGATPSEPLFDPDSYPLHRITKCDGPCS